MCMSSLICAGKLHSTSKAKDILSVRDTLKVSVNPQDIWVIGHLIFFTNIPVHCNTVLV